MMSEYHLERVVVVGLGSIALRHRRNLKILFPNVFIVAVPSSGTIDNQIVDFADQIILNLSEVLMKDVDIAIIASPATFHAAHAAVFLHSGVPTLIEKPVTSHSQDVETLMKISSDTNTPVAVGYCVRYMPAAVRVKKLLEQNTLGCVYNASVNVGQYLPDWRPSKEYQNSVSAKKSLGGGVLLELSHEIDYIQWLLGPMEVEYAQLRSTSELDLEVEELADVILVSETGIVCSIHMDFLQKKALRTCSLIGEKGRLDWDLLSNTVQLHTRERSICLFAEVNWDSNQMYLSLLKDFLNLVVGQQNSIIDLEQAARTVGLIESIKSNAIQGVRQ